MKNFAKKAFALYAERINNEVKRHESIIKVQIGHTALAKFLARHDSRLKRLALNP